MVSCCSRRLLCSAKSLLGEFTAMAILKNETRIGMYDRKVSVSTQRRLDATRVFESTCAKIVFENRLYGTGEGQTRPLYCSQKTGNKWYQPRSGRRNTYRRTITFISPSYHAHAPGVNVGLRGSPTFVPKTMYIHLSTHFFLHFSTSIASEQLTAFFYF